MKLPEPRRPTDTDATRAEYLVSFVPAEHLVGLLQKVEQYAQTENEKERMYYMALTVWGAALVYAETERIKVS